MRDNIIVHNIGLNLDCERDLAIHRALMNVRKDIYKSKNEYIKKCLYGAIYGEKDFVEKLSEDVEEKTSVSKEELKVILSEFKAEIMKEISEMVISLFMGKIFAQLPLETLDSGTAKSIETADEELEATACKYFDGI